MEEMIVLGSFSSVFALGTTLANRAILCRNDPRLSFPQPGPSGLVISARLGEASAQHDGKECHHGSGSKSFHYLRLVARLLAPQKLLSDLLNLRNEVDAIGLLWRNSSCGLPRQRLQDLALQHLCDRAQVGDQHLMQENRSSERILGLGRTVPLDRL